MSRDAHTIDMTPTWEQAAECYLAVLQDGTPEGKRLAADEVRRMGRILDTMQRNIAKAKEVTRG